MLSLFLASGYTHSFRDQRDRSMSGFLDSLFKNRKQKVAWFFYVIFLLINWDATVGHNNSWACDTEGHNCHSLLDTSLVVTTIFMVIALIFRSKEIKTEENSQMEVKEETKNQKAK